jgi:hypothetical protein
MELLTLLVFVVIIKRILLFKDIKQASSSYEFSSICWTLYIYTYESRVRISVISHIHLKNEIYSHYATRQKEKKLTIKRFNTYDA